MQEYAPGKSPLVCNIIPGLAERGKIKIGFKGELKESSGGKNFQQPKKLDYFIVTGLERDDKTNNLLPDKEVYGKLKLEPKPKRLPVTFFYDEIELNLQSRLACYVGKKLWCSGDGMAAFRRSKDSSEKTWGDPFQVQCPCVRFSPEYDLADKCKINATLSVALRGLDIFGGVYRFRTTSYNSYQALLGTMIQARHATGGRLAGLPFDLVIGPKTAIVPKTGAVTTVYIVSLEFHGDVKMLRDETKRLMLEDKEYFGRLHDIEQDVKKYVTADVPETEEAEFVEEMYPEQAAKAVGVPLAPDESDETSVPPLVSPDETTETEPEPDEEGGCEFCGNVTSECKCASAPPDEPEPANPEPVTARHEKPKPSKEKTDLF